MIKRIGLLLVAGIVLASCGTISASSAMSKWVSESSFPSTRLSILADAKHAVVALQRPTATGLFLHTVCGVLLVDTEQANASLPTPDDQATNLLSKAYDDFGAGANLCYKAGTDASKRKEAVNALFQAATFYAEANVRIGVVKNP